MNPYQTQASREALARQMVASSLVLLKNEDHCLPLRPGRAAFFGRAAYRLNISGSGSGDAGRGKKVLSLPEACAAQGIVPAGGLDDFYKDYFSNEVLPDPFEEFKKAFAGGADLVASGVIYEFFGRYNAQIHEVEVPREQILAAAGETDTAIYVLGRATGGEECDRRLEDDFELLEGEIRLLDQLCQAFKNVVVVLNVNGMVNLSGIRSMPQVKAILFAGLPGEMGALGIADVLSGAVSPSGKMAFTMAASYGDYPASKDFSYNKDDPDSILEYKDYSLDAAANGSKCFEKSPVTVYREGIYIGYRYFDTFGKDVLYPFGYGLSYAAFKIKDAAVSLTAVGLDVTAVVANVGDPAQGASGREVVQVYVSRPQGRLEQPYQIFAGCCKTPEIGPGTEAQVAIPISWKDLASYDEESSSWILEAGDYVIRVGNSSRDTFPAAVVRLSETVICETAERALALNPANEGKISFLSSKDSTAGFAPVDHCVPVISLKSGDVKIQGATAKNGDGTLTDMAELTAQMTIPELAVLVNGYGPGLPFGGFGTAAPPTIQYEDGTDIAVSTHKTGNAGYISPAIEKYGIPSVFYKDGPAGVGKIAWPVEMLIACSFDADMAYAFGAACGQEADELMVDSWLGPALNLHRNPLGGRNFEYFSEDPVLSGILGAAIAQGAAQNCKTTVCPKHFAVNEQETYRRGSLKKSIDAVDSILTERTAREVYLKPFEMVIKTGCVRSLMTAFNKINGVFAAGNADLCTRILRDEWGFDGVVVTDWGDMDIVVDGADAVAAGNDVIMPGGPPVIRQVLKGYEEGRVSRGQLEAAVIHLMKLVKNSQSYKAWCMEKD